MNSGPPDHPHSGDATSPRLSRFILVTAGLDGQTGGVQRVTRSVLDAAQDDPSPSCIWSSNDMGHHLPSNLPARVTVRCFGRRYLRMAAAALTSPLPHEVARVFCWHLRLLPVAALFARRRRCPLDVFLHGVEAWGPLPLRLRWALRRVDRIGANSAYTLQRFREVHPEFADRPGKVVPLGLAREFMDVTPDLGPRENERPFLLTVTRFAESYKGEETLLRAMVELRPSHPELTLFCVGEGPSRPRWQARAEALGLAGVVRFTGAISDAELADLDARCLGFALLSEGEGFGIVYLEAMAHGKACVATNADASCELVQDGITGLVVPPGDVAATAAALRRLVEDRGLALRLGAEGKRRVLENYLPRHFQARLTEFMSLTPDPSRAGRPR